MRKAKNIFANIDSLSIILYLILVFFGWFNIYASQYNDDIQFTLDFSNRYGKQLYFIGITLLCAFIILIIDWKFYYSLSYILYALIILSLISLIFIFKTIAIAPVSVGFVLFMNVLELLVAALQAYIFTLLSSLFIGMAVAEHEHH